MRNSLAGIMAILLGGFVMSGSTAKATGVADSEQVSKLLSEAKTLAYQVREDAATMETYTRMNASWQSHAVAINQIKDHVNALGRKAAELRDAKAGASPWQKTAIDRITPYLGELANYTDAVIEHLNGEKKHTLADYNDYLEANADYAADLAAMIANFVDYGKSKARMESLGAKLEIPAAK